MAPPPARVQPGSNRLLDLLPADEVALVSAQLDEIQLVAKQVLARPGEPYSTVIFPRGAVISVLVPMGEEPSVEAGVIGFEGMVGYQLVFGVDTGPHEVICQVSDGGWQTTPRRLLSVLPRCPGLRNLIERYSVTFANQAARSSACNRAHDINQRLARWLLLVHDRVPGDELALTQEFLSEMLGVRRPSVSLAASTLQHAGLISYRWGRITILNRAGLEEATCGDYQQTVDEYELAFAS